MLFHLKKKKPPQERTLPSVPAPWACSRGSSRTLWEGRPQALLPKPLQSAPGPHWSPLAPTEPKPQPLSNPPLTALTSWPSCFGHHTLAAIFPWLSTARTPRAQPWGLFSFPGTPTLQAISSRPVALNTPPHISSPSSGIELQPHKSNHLLSIPSGCPTS